MNLGVYIYGNLVHFTSGAVENPTPGGAPPAQIQISLDNDPTCFGYWITIDAERSKGVRVISAESRESS